MREWTELMREYQAMGGVLEFEWFDGVKEGPSVVLACVRRALELRGASVDVEGLGRLARRRLNERQFAGGWFDRGDLIYAGTATSSRGVVTVNPRFQLSWRGNREVGSYFVAEREGSFLQAFSDPPYGMAVAYAVFEELFREVLDALLAGGVAQEIDEYGWEGLEKISDYFDLGAEWWGTYLWTIYDWRGGRVCVILGSSTD